MGFGLELQSKPIPDEGVHLIASMIHGQRLLILNVFVVYTFPMVLDVN